MDLRPVVWDATVVAPRGDRGVTIVIRTRFRRLEEIRTGQAVMTESALAGADAPLSRILRPVAWNNAWTADAAWTAQTAWTADNAWTPEAFA